MSYKKENIDIAWCPGCGNYPIRDMLDSALGELSIDRKNFVMVSGIGQAAKSPQYMDVHYFNCLHGRALPPATAIKAANPSLTVVVESGDGDMYGEGGNHFIHTIRRNPNITVIVHDNMIYGLTKGQASPTTMKSMVTPVQVNGVFNEPFNPLAVAISLDCSFVARANAGDKEETKEMFKRAIAHQGFALVDVFQACVSFNKVNTFKWYKDNTYYLEGHDTSDRIAAFRRSLETERLPLGVFYQHEKPVFEAELSCYRTDKRPLFQRTATAERIDAILDGYRGG